jgi:hypothetical protein
MKLRGESDTEIAFPFTVCALIHIKPAYRSLQLHTVKYTQPLAAFVTGPLTLVLALPALFAPPLAARLALSAQSVFL